MRIKQKPEIELATLNKTQLREYLGIGQDKLKKLMSDPNFPKPKPIINKWSIQAIDNWLNDAIQQGQNNKKIGEDYIVSYT